MEENKKEALDLGIKRYLDCCGTEEGGLIEDPLQGDLVEYSDHMAIVGPLVMENLTLKLENEAYQKHIKEVEDVKQ